MSNEKDSGLDLVAPQEVTLKLRDGLDVTFGPVKIKQLKAFKAAVMPIAGEIAGILDSVDPDNLDISGFVDRIDEMTDAVAIATGLDRAYLGELHPDEFFLLLVKVVRVNVDFFVQSLMPKLKAASQQMVMLAAIGLKVQQKAQETAGLTASKP